MLDELAAYLKVSHRTAQRITSPAAGKERWSRRGSATSRACGAGEVVGRTGTRGMTRRR